MTDGRERVRSVLSKIRIGIFLLSSFPIDTWLLVLWRACGLLATFGSVRVGYLVGLGLCLGGFQGGVPSARLPHFCVFCRREISLHLNPLLNLNTRAELEKKKDECAHECAGSSAKPLALFLFSLLATPLLLLLLLRVARRRRDHLQVLHIALKLAPVLQLHHAPSGVGVEPCHDAPLPVHLLRLEAVQLDASADGNGRGGGGGGG